MMRDRLPTPEVCEDTSCEPEWPIEESEQLIDLVIAAHDARQANPIEMPSRVDGVVIGRLVGMTSNGTVLVQWPGCSAAQGQEARAMTTCAEADIGRAAALLFENGDPAKPVLMGLLFQAQGAALPALEPSVEPPKAQVVVDGERVVVSAEKELVLQCGEASITLTRAGKVIVRGAYLSSRSTGVNRIQGASVEIN